MRLEELRMRTAIAITTFCLAVASFALAGLGAQEPVVEVFKSPT